MLDWKEHITADPKILNGKPIIKGTRISIEFLIERLADGWTEEEIFENYPHISKIHLQAVYAYVYTCMKDGLLFIPKKMVA